MPNTERPRATETKESMFGSGGYAAGSGDPSRVDVSPPGVAFQPHPAQNVVPSQQSAKDNK